MNCWWCTVRCISRSGKEQTGIDISHTVRAGSPRQEAWVELPSLAILSSAFLEMENGLCIGSLSSLLYKTVQGESHLAKFNSLNSSFERREREDTALTFDPSLAFHPIFGLHDPMVGSS